MYDYYIQLLPNIPPKSDTLELLTQLERQTNKAEAGITLLLCITFNSPPIIALIHILIFPSLTHTQTQGYPFFSRRLAHSGCSLPLTLSHRGPLISKHWALFILSPLRCLTSITYIHTQQGQPHPPTPSSFPHMNTDTLAKTAAAVCLMFRSTVKASVFECASVRYMSVCVCVCRGGGIKAVWGYLNKALMTYRIIIPYTHTHRHEERRKHVWRGSEHMSCKRTERERKQDRTNTIRALQTPYLSSLTVALLPCLSVSDNDIPTTEHRRDLSRVRLCIMQSVTHYTEMLGYGQKKVYGCESVWLGS